MIPLSIYLIIITILFLFYVELTVGNVIYRIVSTGEKKWNIYYGISYLLEPLKNTFLWNWRLLDVNYIFIITVSIIIYQNILVNLK
jgi:hypothetical protein|tara:strand:- start:777 stop:1034 length:258 start_codon:yes stop_codon:yes gene_type:complete